MGASRHRYGSLAVAMPAYNEADGIQEFLTELHAGLVDLGVDPTYVVIDDCSSDTTSAVVCDVRDRLNLKIEVLTNETNMGHGPSLLRAYRAAVGVGTELVLQVDGDGQFFPEDLGALFAGLADAELVVGRRIHRADPWFRKVLSRTLRGYLRVVFGAVSTDANSPFRLFRTVALSDALKVIPHAALVPNVYLTAYFSRSGTLREVPVRHRVRRGDPTEGSTWGPRRIRLTPPSRLVRLVLSAARESFDVRSGLKAQSSPRTNVAAPPCPASNVHRTAK